MQKSLMVFPVIWLIFSLSAWVQLPSNIVKVTADGYSYLGEEDTMKQAKERAMKDAERNAIEQGTGVYLESYSKVNMNMLVKDEVKTLAAGYLMNKKVVIDRLESEPPRYHVQIEAEVKCADMDKLIAARKAEAQPQQTALSVEFAVVAERKLADGSWGEVLVKDGGQLKSFDKFQVHLQPNDDCYLYLLFYDSQGKATLLFPSEIMGMNNFVRKRADVRAPGKNLFYELDTATGVETIYLIASAHPMPDIDWLLEKMEQAGADSLCAATLERTIHTRGIGRITEGRKAGFSLSDGQQVEKVTEVVTGKGAVVRKLSFTHLP
ncbi:MAG: DUF4384 domain-containing protein [Candidatus Zhuqueibacterota bacterium]